jgi:NAD(P)-dependent dehydrogenase (short-subunit alcohol dehydrogenase family)
MTGFLTGRTAVVTGGGRGIGAATAVALADAGVTHLALVARSPEQLQVTAEQVRRTGAAATAFAVDLLDLSALPKLVADITSAVGGVDILINNAATVAPLGPSDQIVPDAFRDALTLNVPSSAGKHSISDRRVLEAWPELHRLWLPRARPGGDDAVQTRNAAVADELLA